MVRREGSRGEPDAAAPAARRASRGAIGLLCAKRNRVESARGTVGSAWDGTRTRKPSPALAPKASAFANFATQACRVARYNLIAPRDAAEAAPLTHDAPAAVEGRGRVWKQAAPGRLRLRQPPILMLTIRR